MQIAPSRRRSSGGERGCIFFHKFVSWLIVFLKTLMGCGADPPKPEGFCEQGKSLVQCTEAPASAMWCLPGTLGQLLEQASSSLVNPHCPRTAWLCFFPRCTFSGAIASILTYVPLILGRTNNFHLLVQAGGTATALPSFCGLLCSSLITSACL